VEARVVIGRRLRLVALLEAGAIADWEADALAYQTAAVALRHPLHAWYVPLWRGMRALSAGRFGECRDALAEVAGTGTRAGSRNADMDPAPFFRGLPDDRCQCPHWGVVLSGRIIFRYPDHDEVYTAGDAYYGAPGHLPLLFAGTELVEFSPTGPLNESMAVIGKNLEAGRA